MAGSFRLNQTLAPTAASRMMTTTLRRPYSTCTPGVSSFWIGCQACCWRAAITPKKHSATTPPT